MEYWIYILYLGTAIDINGVFHTIIKIGSTLHPAYRKWAYSTYSPKPPVYLHLFQLAPEAFHDDPQNLYDLDHRQFPNYLLQTGRAEVHLQHSGGSEWYQKEGWDYVHVLHEFFQAQGIHIIQQHDHDPYPMRPMTEQEQKQVEAEDTTRRTRIVSPVTCDSFAIKRDFFATFLLPGQLPRRNQLELWDRFEAICNQWTEHHIAQYQGIVQWATGTGKTIALLMLFVLSARASTKHGVIFRGLLLSPKNDIFDTILPHIRKLAKWGITICEGHHGQLSSLVIPTDTPILLLATHASLTTTAQWDALPAITHFHYDEVHRITGDEFHIRLQQKRHEWATPFLTGTSATPKTSASAQHKKLADLFGHPLQILHRCDVDEAIQEGWIAQPRFGVHVLSNMLQRAVVVRSFVEIIRQSITEKQAQGKWGGGLRSGGKVIVYLPAVHEVCKAVSMAKEIMPEWHLYTAVDDDARIASSDDLFLTDPADGQPRILFACERYREGSDIYGLDMTLVLMGDTIAAYILLQIAGRALRCDYAGKEGWCIIVRPSDDGTTEDDVFDSIVLNIMECMGKDSEPSKEKTRRLVEKFFGPVAINGKVYHVEETIQRIQAMYARKAFERADPKEKYEVVRALNREMGLGSRHEYDHTPSHPKYIVDPKAYFKDQWVSWYHFLGVDTSAFPLTKAEWTARWKQMGIRSWTEYNQKKSPLLPAHPGEMYESYTNPSAEFNEEDEIVW